MSEKTARVTSLAGRVVAEIERVGYTSHDPYDLLGSGPIVWLRQRKSSALSAVTSKEPTPKQKIIRAMIAPIYQSTYTMALYRLIFGVKPVQHPKTMGLMLQGYLALYRATGERGYVERAHMCAQWLMANSDQLDFGHYCWGLPWMWPSDDQIPRFGPQSTISAVNGLGFVELFEATGEERYLEVARSVCDFYLEHLNIDRVAPEKWAFSYTPYDKTHIVNVNFHCAALFARVWQKTQDQRYLDTLLKICNFSIAEQRPDGAWHYSAAVDGFVNAVDNTHTGDNLEYLTIIRRALGERFPYEEAYRKGIDYYLERFMSADGMPYYTDTEIYPVESHPACQMLITLAWLADIDNRAMPMAHRLVDWITANMMNGKKDRMFYRIYDSGRVDRSYSISWGDAWLVKGLGLLLEAECAASGGRS
jgi:rhamnogalacturonyl hydrolase YesR